MRIRMDFKKSFRWRSNLSNICIIRMLHFVTTPGLKTGWKMTFFGLKCGLDSEKRAAHLHQEFSGELHKL